MGRRKERRIAAAAGRRVKLDLFAEPSGGLGAQNEVGGDDDTKNQVGLSNSPSSSGKQPEDPLALLGQYSDDESDGHSSGSSGEQRRAVVQDFIDTLDKPAQLSTAHGSDGSAIKEVNGYTSQKEEQPTTMTSPALMEIVQKTEDSHSAVDRVTIPVVMMEDNDIRKENPTFNAREAEDVISGWKIVLHEESNQHYYWNVTTGETSWEIPNVLAQQTNSTWGKKDSAINENMGTAIIDEILEHSENEDLEDNKDSGDLVQTCLNGSLPPVEERIHAPLSPQSNVFSREAHDDTRAKSPKLVHGQDYEGVKHLQSYLLKHYEHLMEKVNCVEGSKCELHGHDQMLKYSWELEIRLADIKALASYESSLTPYWEYCKGRFLQLEAAVNDVLQCLKCKELDEVYVSHEARENSSDDKVENVFRKEPVCASEDLNASESAVEMEVSKKYPEVCTDDTAATGLFPSDYLPDPYCGNGTKVNESERIAKHPESTAETVFHSEEDVDMDVDMEVEDIAPSSMSTVGEQPPGVPLQVPLDKLNQPSLAANLEPFAHEQIESIFPAPDNDWVPPPPTDNEPIPPPPPDDPLESITPQSSALASVQSFSYPENFSYSNPHFQYYGQADTELHNSSVFANAEAYQQTISHPTLYYEASAESYGPTLAVNPVLPSVYFGVQEGTLQPAHDSYGVSSDSVYKDSDATGSLNKHAVGSASSLSKSEVNASTIAGEASGASIGIPHSEAPNQESVTVLASETISVSSVPTVTESVAAASASTSTSSKGQSKVVRPKKRTVAAVSSLRSNKKVSSLVDKWKAAKEELEEEEEKEPKNAYEKLEMKRHRAIEEWRAQQIASGEAKDNANFQPLGGDWRERVKRKRAQLANESSSASPSDGEGKQQPDLNELSKGLPLTWQVYWDDSSKQAYYANSVTLETTWIRPTN